jgi:hypothetical protein
VRWSSRADEREADATASGSTPDIQSARLAIEYAAKELYLLGEPNRSRVTFHGPTMLPFLHDGDQLTIRPVASQRIRAGDIITYRQQDKFPTCRVARRHGAVLTLKADNWPDFSAVIDEQDVVGRVVQRRRGDRLLTCDDWAWRLYTLQWRAREGCARWTFWRSRIRSLAV